MVTFMPIFFELIKIYRSTTGDQEERVHEVDHVDILYDFIVVGGGSAGAVVANRLSEISGWRVLLLEAGEDESEASDVPILANSLQMGVFDWKYQPLPQPGRACLAMKNGRCN